MVRFKHFIFFIIRDRAFKLKYQYFHINQKNSNFFFYQGRHRGVGAIFLFSLLSNIDINIFILIKKNLFPRASQVGGGNIYILIFFISRDRTFKHKYQYFHIYQGYKKNLYISENIHRDTQLFKLVKVLVKTINWQNKVYKKLNSRFWKPWTFR